MSSWTGRFLSHAGRLQLISSVITSLANFWLAAFHLPGSCLKEIERLCSTFLWSGPELKTTKAKVCWKDICLPKSEGGLGIRPLKKVNIVHSLKLIWRLFSTKSSLWVRWIHCYLIRKGSFWSVSSTTTLGSWIWRKLLKLRDLAKDFLSVEIRNGMDSFFWYDVWSRFGNLKSILGDRGLIDFGIRDNATVAEVLGTHRRRRRHRLTILNEIEEEIAKLRLSCQQEDDVYRWKQADNKFTTIFSSKKTWDQIRSNRQSCTWSKGVWFSLATPKYAFFLWVVMRDRLQTADRMRHWSIATTTTCVLCNVGEESCDHLFFGCRYSGQIWKKLNGGIMQDSFTTDWNVLKLLLSNPSFSPAKTFIFRYALQATMHSVWGERNARRHGQEPRDITCLVRFIDRTMRLKLLSVKGRGHKHLDEELMIWFGAQENGSAG